MFGVTAYMSPMDLVICFRGEKHHVGLIYLEDFTVDRIRVKALKITTVYGLEEAGMILLTFMNPKNKVERSYLLL